jgi:NADH-quinone oxidoreductase subunit D
VALAERPRIYEGTRVPSPIPTVLQVPETLRGSEDLLQVNFGPNHPSTHGVLRLIVDLHGENVVGLEAVIGYLHTGFEKNMEAKTWWKAITYPERIDYLSFQNNELVFVLAIEKLLGIEVPEKATWMRMCLAELNRIHSHLVWLGTAALELGAISMFWYCFRERDSILDLFELVGGTRMHTRYFQAGGLAEDIPRGFFPETRTFVDWMPKAVDDYEAILDQNAIWLERTKGLGLLSAEDALALAQSGPVLRGSGVDWDLRRVRPGELQRPGLLQRRRLGPVQGSHGRDAGVDPHRRPVPRPPRGHGGRTVDR